MSVANQQHLFTSVFLCLPDISDDRESGNSAGGMYVLKKIWPGPGLRGVSVASSTWMSASSGWLGRVQALLPAPKPPVHPSSFTSSQTMKVMLKSCTL